MSACSAQDTANFFCLTSSVELRSRSAQIRSGIWRRNGPGMTDQVLNYSGESALIISIAEY